MKYKGHSEKTMSARKKNNLCTEYRMVYYSTTITPLFYSNSHWNTGIPNLQVLPSCKQITRSPLVPENVYVSIGELQGIIRQLTVTPGASDSVRFDWQRDMPAHQ